MTMSIEGRGTHSKKYKSWSAVFELVYFGICDKIFYMISYVTIKRGALSTKGEHRATYHDCYHYPPRYLINGYDSI